LRVEIFCQVQDGVVAMHQRPSLPPLVPLSLGDLQPADHIDGLRVEKDGHLNPEYHKEILVGNHHEFESESETKLMSRLKVIFNK